MSITIDKILPIASAIIKNSDNKLLLIQRSKIASYPNHWQLVEGKIEGQEKIDHALRREIEEEIGAEISMMEIDTTLYKDLEAKGLRYLAIRILFNVFLEKENIRLSTEHEAFGWFTKEEALALPLLPGVDEVIKKIS